MKAGLSKVDITPRLGVEMSGFGPYIHRVATEVRDHLYARALAVDDGNSRWVLVGCDLLGVDAATVAEARKLIAKATNLANRQIMIHATHTHSGPATTHHIGWGEVDTPYYLRLPSLIARAAEQAVANLAEASFSYAAALVEHIAFNREIDKWPTWEQSIRDDWQPAHPEAVDRFAHVIRIESRGKLVGFVSSYSCHPVVCCEETHSLHGDFAGVATNLVESDFPGCVGIFLQGSLGDINSSICHQPQELSMHGLNIQAARYARVIRDGLALTRPFEASPVGAALEQTTFRRTDWPAQRLQDEIASYRQKIVLEPSGDSSQECRMNTVYFYGMREVLANLQVRGTHQTPVDIQAFRLGPVRIMGTPFELFRGIKERLVQESGMDRLMVLSQTNDCMSYAVTRERFAQAHYAAAMVPFITGICPFTPDLEDEIVTAGLRLLKQLDQ